MTLDVTGFTFHIQYNKETLNPYTFPSEYIYFKSVTLSGDLDIDYMGFPFVGKSS